MTAPLKFAICAHTERENYSHGKCEECWNWINNPNAPCPHSSRKLDSFGRCSSCMSRYYELRRRRELGDKFGTIRTTNTRLGLEHVKDRKELNKLVKRKRRLTKYKLTLEDYDRMFVAQDGKCAICASPPRTGFDLSVDHNHSCCSYGTRCCGKCVRGLICHGCNIRLGHIESDLLFRSLNYLKLTNSNILNKIYSHLEDLLHEQPR